MNGLSYNTWNPMTLQVFWHEPGILEVYLLPIKQAVNILYDFLILSHFVLNLRLYYNINKES